MAHIGRKRALLSWSGGKDAAFVLNQLLTDKTYEPVGLLTTISETTHRIPIHGVSLDLVQRQAQALDMPLTVVGLPHPCPNEVYESRLLEAVAWQEVDVMAFGDLFLADIREYREKLLAKADREAIFPLWKIPTAEFAQTIIKSGFKSKIVSVDVRVLPEKWLGKEFDEEFVKSLPKSVDPCGENGEFHTFTWQGPNFLHPIPVLAGNVHSEGDYRWIDLKLNLTN